MAEFNVVDDSDTEGIKMKEEKMKDILEWLTSKGVTEISQLLLIVY